MTLESMNALLNLLRLTTRNIDNNNSMALKLKMYRTGVSQKNSRKM